MTVPLEDRVKRIDPASNAIADTIRVAGGPAAVATGAGAVWATSRRDGTLTRIDPRTTKTTRTVRLGGSAQGVVVAGGAVWVAVQPSPPRPGAIAGAPPDVLRVLRPEGIRNGPDPAVAFGAGQILRATCALLFDYPDRPIPDGARLQPEVAVAMPEVTDRGRTYTIRVRPGFRFSPPSNQPVTAEAFARALERGIHPRTGSYAAVLMSDIAGAEAYSAGRARRLAGVSARGDRLTIRLVAPSVTLAARLANQLFCAIPPATPLSGAGTEAIPMAGPYYMAAYAPGRRLLLRRNPSYGGDRPARLREIDFDLDVTQARAAALVEAGRADYVAAVPVDRVARLAARYGSRSAAARAGRQRYFSGASPALHYFVFNTRRPPFAAARLRRAVNFALDRPALADRVAVPAPGPGRATDQVKIPGTPGYRDVAIYPLGGPDLRTARRLAGHGRRRARLVTCSYPACVAQARVLRRNLAAIGIDVEIDAVSLDLMFARLDRPRGWDIGYSNWFPDSADPSDLVAAMLAHADDSFGAFHDAGLARRAAAALELEDLDARTRAFEALDADLTRAAPIAPFAAGVTTDLFADRIGCQVEQPLYGIALGSLCAGR